MNSRDAQGSLFELSPRTVEPAPLRPELTSIAERLPGEVRLGTMSWSYVGWIGLVYASGTPRGLLSERGLGAYSKNPLLRAVEIDRTYYEPLAASVFEAYAAQVPEGFRFTAKASEECVVPRFPTHPRYGKRRGELNPRYLDASWAADMVVAPFIEGLGHKAGVLVFQFPPLASSEHRDFPDQLHSFLARLPRGRSYAVEVRNPELLTPAYAAALADSGAVHCHSVWTGMPSLHAQAKLMPVRARRPLVLRWLMRRTLSYEDAQSRYEPFDRVAEEDAENLAAVADMATQAALDGVPAWIAVDNKAEGCAPETIARLAKAIVERGALPAPGSAT
jgi:uncharacterized protein YecE (DUF72 family)